jgi:hypothetical protein
MEELRNIDEKFNSLIQKRKQKDIDLKTCYNNIEEINILINRLNNIDSPSIIERKDELIGIYENEKNWIINYIIDLSYTNFMENIDTGKDYKFFLLDIQKSSFYTKYENNIKIKTMEIYYMMEELKINNDYYNTLIKLREILKDIYDLELENEIKEFIRHCEIGYLNGEKNEIKKLINLKEFNKVKSIYEKISKEFKSDYIVKNIKKEYNCFLKHINI